MKEQNNRVWFNYLPNLDAFRVHNQYRDEIEHSSVTKLFEQNEVGVSVIYKTIPIHDIVLFIKNWKLMEEIFLS